MVACNYLWARSHESGPMVITGLHSHMRMMFRRGPRTNSKFQSKLLESKPKELISPVMPYSFKTAMLRDPVPDTAGHSLRTFPHQAIRPNKSRDHILDDQDVVMTTFHQRKISNKIHLNDLQRRQIRKIRENRHLLSSRQCNSICTIQIIAGGSDHVPGRVQIRGHFHSFSSKIQSGPAGRCPSSKCWVITNYFRFSAGRHGVSW